VLTATLVLSAALNLGVAQAQGPASSSAGESSAMQLQVLSNDQTVANQTSGKSRIGNCIKFPRKRHRTPTALTENSNPDVPIV
jgi:hypothetical protein